MHSVPYPLAFAKQPGNIPDMQLSLFEVPVEKKTREELRGELELLKSHICKDKLFLY